MTKFLNIGGGNLYTDDDGNLLISSTAIAEALGSGSAFTPIGAPVTAATFATAYPLVFPTGANMAYVQVYAQNVRVGFGTDPTASVGFQKTPADGPFEVYAVSDPRLIQETATATAYILYGYKP
jgi:hypothetical protein